MQDVLGEAHNMDEEERKIVNEFCHLLEKSKANLVLSVACYDLGEYVRHYGRGKQ